METFDCQFSTDHLGVSFLIKTKLKRERVVRYACDLKKANFTDAQRQAISVTPLDMGFVESKRCRSVLGKLACFILECRLVVYTNDQTRMRNLQDRLMARLSNYHRGRRNCNLDRE